MRFMIGWYEEMSVGVRELDEQHQHLFSLVNGVIASTEKGELTTNDFWVKLSNIADYSLYHLSAEEEYMDMFDCKYTPHFEAHEHYRREIKEFMNKVEAAKKEGSAQVAKFAAELAWFAGHWHVEHILVMDKGYTKCFNQHGLY